MNIEDNLKRVPTYTEVVAAYKLDILKPGDDLQFTASGGFALTAYGDLKRGDDRFNAMQSFVIRWCFNAPTLEGLFKLVTDAPAEKRRLDDEMNNIAPIIFFTCLSGKIPCKRDEIGACTFGAMACCGAIMVVLNNL